MQNISLVVSDLLNVKKGWKTSEFWVTLVPAFVAVLNVLGVHVANSDTTHILLVVWGAVAAVYLVARTYLKSIHLGHAANLTAILQQLEKEALVVAKSVAGQAGQEVPKKLVS